MSKHVTYCAQCRQYTWWVLTVTADDATFPFCSPTCMAAWAAMRAVTERIQAQEDGRGVGSDIEAVGRSLIEAIRAGLMEEKRRNTEAGIT